MYQEQLSDFKQELGHIRHEVTAQCTRDVSDELHTTITTLDKSVFDMSLKVNKWLYNPKCTSETTVPTHEVKGVRLPKLEVPTFDGDILHWQSFWEQFCVAIHDLFFFFFFYNNSCTIYCTTDDMNSRWLMQACTLL